VVYGLDDVAGQQRAAAARTAAIDIHLEVAGRWYCSEQARQAHERLASALVRGR
jgi:hypothetical protein